MAVEIFLDIDGMPGEAQAKSFENKIEVFSFSFGASNPSGVATGTGSGAGKVDISSVSIQKQLDKASANLFLACCKGTHVAKGKMTVREAAGDDPLAYFIVDFTELFVDSISWGGAAGGGKPSESVSFSFKTIKMEYYQQDETGKGNKVGNGGWDVQKNTKL